MAVLCGEEERPGTVPHGGAGAGVGEEEVEEEEKEEVEEVVTCSVA